MSKNLVTNSTININVKNDVNVHCEIRYKCIILGALFHSKLRTDDSSANNILLLSLEYSAMQDFFFF